MVFSPNDTIGKDFLCEKFQSLAFTYIFYKDVQKIEGTEKPLKSTLPPGASKIFFMHNT